MTKIWNSELALKEIGWAWGSCLSGLISGLLDFYWYITIGSSSTADQYAKVGLWQGFRFFPRYRHCSWWITGYPETIPLCLWKFSSGNSLKQSSYRTTSSVCDVYHDVYVALKSEKFLNNGQPSMIARLIAALELSPGKRVFHCGCGTGYYTAIMAEVVGSTGSVVAAEIDSTLAEIAATNLTKYDHVTVLNRDGTDVDPVPCDAILINAGVTHPHPAWLDAIVVGITRRHDQFAAELVDYHHLLQSKRARSHVAVDAER
jgi:Protein-L-isoaspartate(D-aspartate) O-methyltransferase (PCMT)